MSHERENLTRNVDFVASGESDGNTLEGYAAVFNSPTRIDSWEGTFDEVIAPGAFARTINASTPVMQFDHGAHPMVGSIPLGSIDELAEDARGLFVRARLHDNWLTQPVRDAIASGSITGMSFRFNVVKDEWDDSEDIELRTIREIKLHELGPVVFPAYEDTTVGVRSKVTEVLTDPDTRAELARALVLGTQLPNPSDEDTSQVDPPSHDDPASATRRTQNERRRLARVALAGI